MRARGFRIVTIYCLLFLLFSSASLKAEKISVKVITQIAYVRLKTSIDSMIISKVPLGAVLESIERRGEWYKVALPIDEQVYRPSRESNIQFGLPLGSAVKLSLSGGVGYYIAF